jgi:hypothetical protein
VGLGCAIVAASLSTGAQAAVLPAFFVLVYSLLTALRLCFGVPSELRANWLFQIAAEDSANPHAVVQRAMMLFTSPLILGSTLLYGAIFGAPAAALHLVYLTAASLLLIEILTIEFRVIPFTCSWMPAKGNIVLALTLFLVGLAVFGGAMVGLELYLFRHKTMFIPFFGFAAGALWAFRWLRDSRERITYSDTRNQLQLLDIAE